MSSVRLKLPKDDSWKSECYQQVLWFTSGFMKVKVKVKVAQSCWTLCNPMDYTVHGILQARIMEWVAFPFSRKSSNPRTKPRSPALQADSLLAEPPGKPIAL